MEHEREVPARRSSDALVRPLINIAKNVTVSITIDGNLVTLARSDAVWLHQALGRLLQDDVEKKEEKKHDDDDDDRDRGRDDD